jgi:adenylate cyclase
MARLVMVNTPERYTIEMAREVNTVGRLPECEVMLTDSLVSRRHAEIRREDSRYRIVDLNSLNGVYVNNLRVSNEVLASGDVISIGGVQLLFEDSLPGLPGRGAAGPDQESPPAGAALMGQEIIKPVSDVGQVMHLDYRPESRPGLPAPVFEEKANQNFFILYQVARALNSTNSLDELLELTLTLISQVINVERGVILLLDEKGELQPRAMRMRGQQPGQFPEITVSRTIARRAIEEKVAIITSDAKYDPRFQEGVSIVQYNIRSALCVPLWERETIRGVIYVDNLLQTYAFNEHDLDLLSAIANQVAIAVRQDSLQRRMRQEAIFRANLERFHSPDVVNLIVQQSQAMEQLTHDVEEREVTVLFSDICGFTRLSEKLAAPEVAALIVDYFNEMSKIVFHYRGTVDKFIGDALMAVFGAPISSGNDPELAVLTALEMLRRLEDFCRAIDERKRFQIRIGINTGRVVAGYLGSSRRIEYTVLGDPVNVAARLQDLAHPNTILIGEGTFQKVQGRFPVQERGLVKLKGRQQELRVYQVLTETARP